MSLWPMCGVLVLPSSTPPAAASRSATAPSWVGTLCSKNLEPKVVRRPAVGSRSLMEYGDAVQGAEQLAARARASAARACSRARSAVTVRKAFSFGLSRSIRASTASVTSTGDSSPRYQTAQLERRV